MRVSPAAYGAHAAGLRAVDEASVSDAEVRWAIEHASPAVRQIVQRMPARAPSKNRFGKLPYELDIGLRR